MTNWPGESGGGGSRPVPGIAQTPPRREAWAADGPTEIAADANELAIVLERLIRSGPAGRLDYR